MEKLYFVSRGLKLCGVLEVADPKSNAVVVTIHGYASGKDADTYVKISKGLVEKGKNSFRFDLAGNYESEGKFEDQTISTMAQDALAAMDFLKSKGFNKFSLLGSSGGGLAAMLVALQVKLEKLALIAPVSNYIKTRTRKYGEAAIAEWKKKGYNFYDAGPRGLLRVNYSFYEDLAQYGDLYKRVETILVCPVLIIHGDKDDDVLLSDSEELVTHLKYGKLIVVHGADHKLKVNGDRSKSIKQLVEFLAG